MVVHVLLRVVVSLVSGATFLDYLFLTICLLSVFEYTYLIFWNSFWTLCPVIAIGLFDRIVGAYSAMLISDAGTYRLVDDHVLMALPELYRYGREGKWFGVKLFTVFMTEGVVQVGQKLCF
jgi:hypothetical protein